MSTILSPYVQLFVGYEDETRFGSAVSGEFDRGLRERCREVTAASRSRTELARAMPTLWPQLDRAGALGDLYEAHDRLREDCVHPNPAEVRPRELIVCHPERQRLASIELTTDRAGDLARWLGQWQRDAAPPVGRRARGLWAALRDAEAFIEAPPEALCAPTQGELTFVGHATIAIGRSAPILFDPFLMPVNRSHPAGYQPMTAEQLAPSAVFITHSHPDHYDLGSLLRLGHDLPIYVPAVPRESLLSIDMYTRLGELGFTRVRTMRWGDEIAVGDARVTALPLYGEQPTAEDVLHPDVRNEGNLYRVETPRLRVALTADGGDDRLGSLRAVASANRRDHGEVDVCVGGYRNWAMYPFQYLFTSVSRYVLFVPRHLRQVRHKIMYAPDELLDVAERWGARWVMPYADGGAPWFWERGLGPRLDIPATGAARWLDLPPEAVGNAARQRSWSPDGDIPSPVRPLILRPGESIDLPENIDAPAPSPRAGPAQIWPYAGASA